METISEVMEFSRWLNKINETYGKITVLENGLADGRLIEIFGDESSEKTKTTLLTIAEAQKKKGVAAFVDITNSFDMDFAKSLGVDTENLIMSKHISEEEGIEVAENLIACGAIDIVVVRSISELNIKVNPTN